MNPMQSGSYWQQEGARLRNNSASPWTGLPYLRKEWLIELRKDETGPMRFRWLATLSTLALLATLPRRLSTNGYVEAGPGHRELAYRSGNRRYIDHAQMTVAEPVRVESRGGYFAGAHGKSR